MRILFSGVPAFGHLLPLAPLVRAARTAGHETALLTSGGMTALIAADIPDTPVLGAGPMPDVMFAEVARRFDGADPASDPRPETVAEFFAGTRVDLTFDSALEQAQIWQPDFIVAEATDFVGPMVAAALDIPWSVLAFGPAVPDEFTAPMFDVVASRYAERDLLPKAPSNYIDPVPEALQLPGWTSPAHRLPVRVRPHTRTGWESQDTTAVWDGKPRVLVTLGTVFSDAALLQHIVSSIDLDQFDVIATVGLAPGTQRPDDSDSVTYTEFVPLAELLKDVAMVVNAGGAGTVLASLSAGLPMVILPQGADQFINAERAGHAGAAIVLDDPADVGVALKELADNPSYALAALAVSGQMKAMPEPSDVIEKLVGDQLGGVGR